MIKYCLTLCGLLDLISFLGTYKQGIILMNSFDNNFDIISLFNILQIGLIFSMPVTGIILLFQKKIGLVLYYIQFPLRIGSLILSFGFLFSIFRLPFNTSIYYIILTIAALLEVMRLTFSIIAHKKLSKVN